MRSTPVAGDIVIGEQFMTAFQINSMKHFMNRLLLSDSFNIFLLEDAVISTANTFTIDGHVNREFFQSGDGEGTEVLLEFRPWGEMKGLCFDLIKGKHTPLFFRFTLQLAADKATALLRSQNCSIDLSQVKALALNIRYDGTKAILTTATAYHTFLPSKEPDIIWDRAMAGFLDREGIAYEAL